MSKKQISDRKEKWYEKVFVQVVSGCLIAIVGLITSYYLFIIKARHEDELYGFKDGIFYTVKKMGPSIKGQSICALIGNRYFNHWDLYKDGAPITSPSLLKKAVKETTEGIWRSPEKIRLYWLRGLAYFKLYQYDRAIIDFKHVFHKLPHFINAGMAIATSYCKLGFFDRARDVLEKIIKRKQPAMIAGSLHNSQRKQPVMIAGSVYNSLGNVCCSQDKKAEAIEHYGVAIRWDPNHALAHFNRAMVFLDLAMTRPAWEMPAADYFQALADLFMAIALKPRFDIAFHNCGLAFHKLGLLELAVENYKKAIQINPKLANTLSNLGVIYATYHPLRNLPLAMKQFNKAIHGDPDFPYSYYNRGTTHSHMALQLNPLLKLSLAIVPVWDIKGVAFNCFRSGLHFIKAIEDYGRTIYLKSDFARAYNNRGSARLLLGQYRPAINDLSQALILQKDYFLAYHNRGQAFMEMADHSSDYLTCIKYYLAFLDLTASITIKGLGQTHCLRAQICQKYGLNKWAKSEEREAKKAGNPCGTNPTD